MSAAYESAPVGGPYVEIITPTPPAMTLERAFGQSVLPGDFFNRFYPGKWDQGRRLLTDVTDEDLLHARQIARLDDVDAMMEAGFRRASSKQDQRRFYRPTNDQVLYVWLRDKGVCRYCKDNSAPDYFEPDHYTPFAGGGPTVTHNLVCACHTCNRAKNQNSGPGFDRLAAHPDFRKLRAALYGYYERKPYDMNDVTAANAIMYPRG